MSIAGMIEARKHASGQRGSPRVRLRLNTRGSTASGEFPSVLIHNLSRTGVLLETRFELGLGEHLFVELPEAGEVPAIVVWRSDELIGCRFEVPLPQAVLSAAELRNPLRSGLHLDQLAATAPFCDRLRHFRERAGLSRAALAAKTGFSAPTLWAWETGKTQPRQKSMERIATALQVSVEDLLFGGSSTAVRQEAGGSRQQTGHALQREGPEGKCVTSSESADTINDLKQKMAAALGVDVEKVQITVEF